MNKNAYEIRLDVLSMAHNTLSNMYHEKLNSLRFEAERSNTKFDNSLVDTLAPSTQDIITYATELYKFVEG